MIKIKEDERGLKFIKGEFVAALKPGKYWIKPFSETRIDVINVRETKLEHKDLDFIWRNKSAAMGMKLIKVQEGESALLRINGRFEKFLGVGIHAYWTIFDDIDLVVYKKDKLFIHSEIERMAQQADLFPELVFYDLSENERALVTINKRFSGVLSASVFAFWKDGNQIEVEKVSVDKVFFEHTKINEIIHSSTALSLLDKIDVNPGQLALIMVDGKLIKQASEGRYVYWRNVRKVEVQVIDLRETSFEISGQEIMTSDKVSLRVNALVTYSVSDPLRAVHEFKDYESALYKEAQMILRRAIGSRDLDSLLADKLSLEVLVQDSIKNAGKQMGLEVRTLGLKDIILPGDMKDILNRVTEARKVAEASFITRREETAAMRSQANTAKIMESNPILMKIREMELAEKVAANAKLTVFAGEKGIAESLRALI